MSKTRRNDADEKPERILDDHRRLPRSHPDHPRNQRRNGGVKSPGFGGTQNHRHTRGAGKLHEVNGMNFLGADHC